MRFKKFIAMWALLGLMLGQIALAEHNAAHIDHHISVEIAAADCADHQEEDEHPDNAKSHQCPECVLTKSLQVALYNAPTALLSFSRIDILVPPEDSFGISKNRDKANFARAPPYILI